MELSWVIRHADGSQADCGDADVNIAKVLLCQRSCDLIDPATGACRAADGSDDAQCPITTFDCTDHRGNTAFEIQPGRKELWIRVACATNSTPQVTVPGSLIREVADGEVTELDALLITVPSGGTLACPAP